MMQCQGKEPILYIVVPCYNEEVVVGETGFRLNSLMKSMMMDRTISSESRIIFIDDGSIDKTWEVILNLCISDSIFHGMKLSRNYGHQNALLAGLLTANKCADCVISIDADLQDDLEILPQFVKNYSLGSDVVYGVRVNRETDTRFKRLSAKAFYKLMLLMGVGIIENHADYRLMSHRAIDALSKFTEHNLFLRGVVPLVGFRSTIVYYDRQDRFAGVSKYTFRRMISFAFDGITSFCTTPIRAVTWIGSILLLTSILTIIFVLISKINGHVVPGWSSTMLSIWFLGSMQILSIGIIGEYIGKTYQEVKRRPKFIIEEHVGDCRET